MKRRDLSSTGGIVQYPITEASVSFGSYVRFCLRLQTTQLLRQLCKRKVPLSIICFVHEGDSLEDGRSPRTSPFTFPSVVGSVSGPGVWTHCEDNGQRVQQLPPGVPVVPSLPAGPAFPRITGRTRRSMRVRQVSCIVQHAECSYGLDIKDAPPAPGAADYNNYQVVSQD